MNHADQNKTRDHPSTARIAENRSILSIHREGLFDFLTGQEIDRKSIISL
ncbi:MAG: hypothetical protein IH840_15885 [Candidatus Heimdallarchaeota archaeon]|nr:hypothetical protein [Candidatus Heimdallarchaeota archaeon]